MFAYTGIRNKLILVPRGTKIVANFNNTIYLCYVNTHVKIKPAIAKVIAASALMLSGCVYTSVAQQASMTRLTKLDHRFTVGFEREVYSLYSPKATTVSDKVRKAEERCNRILLRIRLTNKFRIQTGLSYRDIDRILYSTSKCTKFDMLSNYRMSVPLTVQYQLLGPQYKIHPYFGAGVEYNLQPGSIGTSTLTSSANADAVNRLRNMNIIFTQGLIYDITPDLQITQSIHVLPQNGTRQVGVNVGIGYRLK